MVFTAIVVARSSMRRRRRTGPAAPRRGLLSRLRTPGGRTLLLVIGLLLPPAQSAQALDLYYARAIGQEYSPEPPPTAPAPERDPPPAADTELPALGAGAEERRPRGEMSLWSKVLIGVVLVAAVAALGNGDGGSAQVNATPGNAPEPAPPAGPAEGGGAGPGAGDSGPGSGAGDTGRAAPVQDGGASPGPGSGPAAPGEMPAPMQMAGPGPGGPPEGAPGADNRGGFDFELGDNRVRVDPENGRVEFQRGDGRERDGGPGRGRGRGRGGGD